MRWKDKYIAATGIHLPARVNVADEVAAGRYPAEEAERNGMVSFCRAPEGSSALELAAQAAKSALTSLPPKLPPLRALYFSHVGPPGGPPAWNPAGKVHELLGLSETVRPFGVSNGCAAGLVALEEACHRINGDPDRWHGTVLIAAGEAWPRALVDPATAARGLILGDGGAAVILTDHAGFFQILATASQTDSGLADATRGAHSLTYDPAAVVDLPPRYDHFVDHVMPHEEYRQRRDVLIKAVVTEVLTDAGVTIDEVSALIHTHSGRQNLEHGYYRLLPSAAQMITTAEIAFDVGHVGTADPLIGLHILRETGKLKPGALVLMIIGGGSWTEAAVLGRMR